MSSHVPGFGGLTWRRLGGWSKRWWKGNRERRCGGEGCGEGGGGGEMAEEGRGDLEMLK